MNEYNIKCLVLDIDPSNIASIKTALNAGYELDEEEYIKRGMTGKILYRLDNYNYINKRSK
jgi:RimJ/RimL family protein N-acetyltransferase